MLQGYKTIIAALIALVGSLATQFGVDIGDQTALVEAIMQIGGAILAIIFRITATTTVGGARLETK